MEKHRWGLSLSGGGMSCAAQIGVLKVLEEEGISPSIISGTSGGAIVGALLANRISCDEMFQVFKKANLFSLYHFARRKAGLFDIESYNLLEPYFPKDSFEALSIPLVINATELQSGKTVYFSKGKLINKIFASAAFPGLFAPVDIDNKLYADGGILENLPTQAIRNQCTKLVAINVNATPEIPLTSISNPLELVSRALRLSLSLQKTYRPEDCDLMISPSAIADHTIFSKSAVDTLYKIGYDEGKKVLSELKELL